MGYLLLVQWLLYVLFAWRLQGYYKYIRAFQSSTLFFPIKESCATADVELCHYMMSDSLSPIIKFPVQVSHGLDLIAIVPTEPIHANIDV